MRNTLIAWPEPSARASPGAGLLVGLLGAVLAGSLGHADAPAKGKGKRQHHRRHRATAQRGGNDQGDTLKPDGLPCKKHAQCQSGHCCDFTKRKPGTCRACCPDACASGQCLTCGPEHTCVSSCTAPQTCGGGGTPGACGSCTCPTDAVCGDSDGCGGKCQGSCPSGQTCNAGQCCTPTCPTDAVCGASDGCGGRCQGTCSPPIQGLPGGTCQGGRCLTLMACQCGSETVKSACVTPNACFNAAFFCFDVTCPGGGVVSTGCPDQECTL